MIEHIIFTIVKYFIELIEMLFFIVFKILIPFLIVLYFTNLFFDY